MSLLRFARSATLCLAIAAPSTGVVLAGSYATNGLEYPIAGMLPGDQVRPQLSVGPNGGFLVWEDNITDPYGLGVSAMRLDSGFSPVLSPFRVNVTLAGDQNHPQVSMLKSGGAAFIWQGGPQGSQHIYARMLSASNVWSTGEVMASTTTNRYQTQPAIATLAGSNVAVVWASINQVNSNSMQDVYGQILTPSGAKVGTEFAVNQFTSFNQRNPAIAALADGRFVVVWVSEQQRALAAPPSTNSPISYGLASVDVYARIFSATGVPTTGELLVNTSSALCSSPKVAAAADGTFMIVWTEQDRAHGQNGMDIWGRKFSAAGTGSAVQCINTTRYGDQYEARISADSSGYFVVWSSLGQDGSEEGVFGQFVHYDGSPDGGEIQINNNWVSHQVQPAVASDAQGRFVAVWTSWGAGVNSFDLFAQRFVNSAVPLPQMAAPFVHAPFTFTSVNGSNVYQPQLQISWPFQAGLPVDHYELYVNGASTPINLTTNMWLMTAANGLTANSTNTFQVDYVIPSGRRSPLSPPATGITWSGQSWGGIPWEWMTAYYGPLNVWFDQYYVPHYNWPAANAPLMASGPSLLQVFGSGASPANSAGWLRTSLTSSPQGSFLTFNTQPGLIYQVQTSTDLASWVNYGGPRFAAGTIDSLYVGGGNKGYYRVLVLR